MSTKTLNGSSPQAAEELIRKSADMSAQILAEHNIMPAKASNKRQNLLHSPTQLAKSKRAVAPIATTKLALPSMSATEKK